MTEREHEADPTQGAEEQSNQYGVAVDLSSIPFPTSESTVAAVESVEQETTLMLRTVLRQIDEELQHVYDQCELNEARIEILKALFLAHPTGCTQVELANSLGQSEANISAMVSRMRRDGWIYRLRSQADRRKSNLLLTSKSLQILGDIGQDIERLLEGLYAPLDKSECRQLANLLGKLHVGLSIPREEDRDHQHPVAS